MHVKNSWHKFRCLDKGQQTQVLALGFTVASLGLGAVISWRHNRQLDKRLQEMEEREAEREQNLMSRF